MTDRRRINGPVGGTLPPVFAGENAEILAKGRTRSPNTARPICEYMHSPELDCRVVLISSHSPQDWRDALSIWFRISRSPNISQARSLWPQTQLHSPWTQGAP